jgi:tRNA(fMet)-specific endonuclease VapC
MSRRLILDTTTLIAYERGTIDRSALDDDELAVASITVAGYRTGIELADTPERAARARALATITSAIDVLDYTAVTAAHHARLLAHVRKSGSPRGAHDLIIAAHAAETGRLLLATDAKARFSDLPGIIAVDALPLRLGGGQPRRCASSPPSATGFCPHFAHKMVRGLTAAPQRSGP